MNKVMVFVAKKEVTPMTLEHIFVFIFGLCCVAFGPEYYQAAPPVGKVLILIIYLGLLVGVAPIPMPVFKSKVAQVRFAGLMSGVLDSFIVLDQCRSLRTVEAGQNAEDVAAQEEDQESEGIRAKFLAFLMIAAIIGGLIIWFGEVYAAGLFQNDGRTGIGSALFIVPPVLLFLEILGRHANTLPIAVVPNKKQGKAKARDVVEFAVFISMLLVTHDPLRCMGWLLMYSFVTNQCEQLFHTWEHHTEKNVMLVLLIALLSGAWLLSTVIGPLGLGTGHFGPIVPSGIQAVLWGAIYEDPSVHFWIRLTNLSTGALLLPVSSLVGVMLYPKLKMWPVYMQYSVPYAILWFLIMRAWIWLALESPVGHFLEQWAHVGGAH